MVFIATGIFTVSPSGIQKPFNNVQNNFISKHNPQTAGKGLLNTVKYLVHGAKNTRTKRFDLLQLRGPQNASVNFCAFLTWAEWLEALLKKEDFFHLNTSSLHSKGSQLESLKFSPLRSPGTSSWLSCGGWRGLFGTTHPGKTSPGRRSNWPGRPKRCR